MQPVDTLKVSDEIKSFLKQNQILRTKSSIVSPKPITEKKSCLYQTSVLLQNQLDEPATLRIILLNFQINRMQNI